MAHVGEEFGFSTIGRLGRAPGFTALGRFPLVDIVAVKTFAHGVERGHYPVEFVRTARPAALQREGLRRLPEVVTFDAPRHRGEMARDEPRENVDGEQRYEKRIGALAQQD